MFTISDTMMTMTTNGASSDNSIHLLDPSSLPNFSFTSFSRLPSLRDLLDPEDDFDFFIQQPDPAPEEAGGSVVLINNIKQHHALQMKQHHALQMKQHPPKRDRHSKIVTARGLRDRRMRLSLEVAKKFFGLQDLLGYEKASKTVEWLLLQANAEINKLSSHIMGFSNNNTGSCIIKAAAAAASKSSCNSSSSSTDHDQKKKKKKKVIKAAVRRWSSLGGVARDELRAKARERAKARTIAKKIKNQLLAVGRSGEEEEESVVRKSSTTPNIIMMLANINQQDDHNHFLIPPQEGDQVNGLISSFGQSWEASL